MKKRNRHVFPGLPSTWFGSTESGLSKEELYSAVSLHAILSQEWKGIRPQMQGMSLSKSDPSAMKQIIEISAEIGKSMDERMSQPR